jgi:hypothetical protein
MDISAHHTRCNCRNPLLQGAWLKVSHELRKVGASAGNQVVMIGKAERQPSPLLAFTDKNPIEGIGVLSFGCRHRIALLRS